MFITPIQRLDISSIGGIGSSEQSQNLGAGAPMPFKAEFEEAIKNVRETDNQVAKDVEMLTTGQSDNLHMLGIDISKAQLSVSMLVQLRNKAMDAYNEVMRINL